MTSSSDALVPTRGYLPGEWYVVLGAGLVLALPADRRDLAATLWPLVDAGADADEVLDALVAGGLRSLDGFALVSEHGSRTRVLLRGPVGWTPDEGADAVPVLGSAASTWHEHVVDEVAGWLLELGTGAPDAAAGAHAGERDEADLRVGAGLVRAARVRHGDVPATGDPATPATAAVPLGDAPEPEPAPAPEPDAGAGAGSRSRSPSRSPPGSWMPRPRPSRPPGPRTPPTTTG